MKHVFVETNFLVDLLRPLPSRDAEALFARNDGVSLQLHVPWCSRAEALRTLTAVIERDLGFVQPMMQFVLRHWLRDRTVFDKAVIDKVRDRAVAERAAALATLEQRIDEAVASMATVAPSPDVVAKTLSVFRIKALKPFDEMTLGAVLQRAAELHAAGERDVHFCELDSDLAGQYPPLVAAYAACGLKVHQGFVV